MHWTRIENGVGEGVPDLHGCLPRGNMIPHSSPAGQNEVTEYHVVDQDECRCINSVVGQSGLEFWLELKVDHAKTFSGRNLWRPRQVAWQTGRSRAGGRVYNLVHRPQSSSYIAFAGVFLLPLVIQGPLALTQKLEFTDLARLPEVILRLESAPEEERRFARTFDLGNTPMEED